jgi:hypothetical protein
VACNRTFTRERAANAIFVGDLAFCSAECEHRWFDEGRLGIDE